MLEVDKPIIKVENKIKAKQGDKTKFLNDGIKFSDLCKQESVYDKNMRLNIKNGSKQSKKY